MSRKTITKHRWEFPHPVPDGVSIYKPAGSTSRVKWHMAYRPGPGQKRITVRVSADARIVQRRAIEIAAAIQQGTIDANAGRLAIAEQKPILDHLQDYHAEMIARGNTAAHADLVRDRCKRIFTAMGISRISEVMPSSVLTTITGFTDLRFPKVGSATSGKFTCACGRRHSRGKTALCARCQKRKSEDRPFGSNAVPAPMPISLASRNHYLRSAKQFFAWLCGPEKRCRDNIIKHLPKWNERTDRRHDRQDLGEDGASALIEAARTGPTVLGVAGADRAMLIEAAVETGFRANELATLVNSPTVFHLDAIHPFITVKAAFSKHRREDRQPIRREFAARLKQYLAEKPGGVQVWRIPTEPIDLIRKDIIRAGIPAVDADGRHADFHSLRHTYVCRLVRAGITPKECQVLARHASITTTMDYYAHLRMHDTAAAVGKLNSLVDTDALELLATGTFGKAQHEAQQATVRDGPNSSRNVRLGYGAAIGGNSGKKAENTGFPECSRQGSNLQPSASEADALSS